MSQRDHPEVAGMTGQLSIEQQIQDVGRFGRALKTNARGRRRAGIALAALTVVLVVAVVALLLLTS